MLARRLRRDAAKFNWFAVTIDLTVLVLGVFLGLQVSNWNEDRIERRQERSFRSQLIEDLRANEEDLREWHGEYKQVRDHALEALKVLEDPAQPGDQQFIINAHRATQILPRTLTRSTYEELIASGALNMLGSAGMRRQVKAYYEGLDNAEVTLRTTLPYREHLQKVMPYGAQRQVRMDCLGGSGITPAGEQMRTTPQPCRIDLNSESLNNAVAQVRQAPGLSADLTRHLIDLDLKLDLITLLNLRAQRLRQAVESVDSQATT